jgi:hypothetical protein
MRKFFPVLLLLILVIACNKQKALKQDIAGVWQVYKYTVHGFDATAQFDSLHPGYTITFTNNGQFIESDTNRSILFANAGTYTFKDNNQVLALIDSASVQIDTITVLGLRERDYTLFDLNKQTVQLVTDSSDTYMSKK